MDVSLLIRPLTKNMLEKLIDCHERELMNLEPYDAGMLPYCAGLIHRGMLGTKTYITNAGKSIMTFYVTYTGKGYLSNL